MQKLRRTELREFHQTLSSTSGISSILQQMIQSMHSVNSVKNSVNICAAKRSVIPSHHVYVLALVATVEESKLHLKPIHPTRKPPIRTASPLVAHQHACFLFSALAQIRERPKIGFLQKLASPQRSDVTKMSSGHWQHPRFSFG